MQDFRRLKVWEKGHELVLKVYQLTSAFPREERFGLIDQIRRAAVSIPANIAEGCGRGSDADFARFVQVAMGSASELEYEILLAKDLGYLADESGLALGNQIAEVKQMLASLLKKLRADSQ